MATIPWSMGATLECVRRGGSSLAEVTSLELAVREWLTLEEPARSQAVLTPKRPFQWRDEGPSIEFGAAGFAQLARELPTQDAS